MIKNTDNFDEFVKYCVDNKESFKVKVTSETSKLVQETLFKYGIRWQLTGSTEVKNLDVPYLFYGSFCDGLIAYGQCDQFFIENNSQEVIVEPLTTLKLVNVIKPKSEEEIAKEKLEKKIKKIEAKLEKLRKLNQSEL